MTDRQFQWLIFAYVVLLATIVGITVMVSDICNKVSSIKETVELIKYD